MKEIPRNIQKKIKKKKRFSTPTSSLFRSVISDLFFSRIRALLFLLKFVELRESPVMFGEHDCRCCSVGRCEPTKDDILVPISRYTHSLLLTWINLHPGVGVPLLNTSKYNKRLFTRKKHSARGILENIYFVIQKNSITLGSSRLKLNGLEN